MRLSDLRSDLRSMGLGGWLSYAADRALGRLSRGRAAFYLLRFYVQPVPASPLVSVRAGDPVHVGPIDRSAIDEATFKRPAGAVPARFDAGSTCIAALKQGEVLGFMWLHPGTLSERIVHCDMRAEPASRVVWDYDFFIEPRYRLGRLFGRLWDAAASHLRERGVEATVSWVHLHNRASAQAHARLGARPIGWAAFLVLFRHQFMISSMRPVFAHAGPDDRLKLRVDAGASLRGNTK